MAVGRPGVPSWIDAAGDQPQRRTGEQDPPADEGWPPAGTVGGASRLQAALSRLLAYGLWGLIALALVLSLINCAGSPSAAPPSNPETTPLAVPPPGGCAELLVAAWLAGDAELLAGIPGMPRAEPEPQQRRAVHTYTAAVTPGDGVWGYLVAAEVEVPTEPDETAADPAGADPTGDWQPAGTQFFRVTMVPTAGSGGCQGWRPAALPAQVPAPPLAGDAASPYEQPYPVSLPASGTELSQTLESFFAGMLTGSESLERYVAPGVFIAPLVPPPYQQVSVSDLRARDEPGSPVPPDGTVLAVLVTVATDADNLPLVYPVTVAVRGGRWEVVGLDLLVGAAVSAPPDSSIPVAPSTPADRTNGD